jgi:hypothetical protein
METADERKARLAKALRNNLRRRKAQMRGVEEPEAPGQRPDTSRSTASAASPQE